MRRFSGRGLVLASVAIVLLAVLAMSLVPPHAGTAIVAVGRTGGVVRLLPPSLAVSFLPLAQRVAVPRADGAAVLSVPVRLGMPGGAAVPGEVRLELTGSGTLPVDAAVVRSEGWGPAWTRWLEPRLGLAPSTVATAVRGSDPWREVLPQTAAAPPIDITAALAPSFSGATLRRADVTVRPDLAMVRAVARDELRREAPAPGRLIVIGLDGLDWRLVDELTRRGVMPNLARLMTRGAQIKVRMRPPLLSPLIWTTIATGQPPEVHGVLDFVEPDPQGGQPRPVTSLSRKVPAMWEMASAVGRTSAVIGWWATFPAAAPPGCTIYSDRLSEQLMGLEENRPGLADPPEAAKLARELAVRGSEVTAAMLAPILEVTQRELDAIPKNSAAWDDPIGGAARLMAATMTVERLTDHELGRGTDIVLSYLEGTDTVGHLFGPYRPPAMPGTDPALARRFAHVVDRYHASVDRWLGTVVARMRPEDSLVILSDHGFTWDDDRPAVAAGAHTPTAVFWHRPDAFFLAVGPRVAADASRRRMGPLDILPTLLALAGLPADADLPGRVPPWLLAPASHHPPVVSYAALAPITKPAVSELPAEAREEELAKLRALGYLSSGESAAPPSTASGPVPAVPTAVPEPTANVGRLEARREHNLGLRLADSGDLAGAQAAFLKAIAADSRYAPPHYAYARVLRLMGRFDEADEQLWTAVDVGLADAPAALARVAGEYRALQQPKRAAAVLAKASERFPDAPEIWLDLGTMLGEQHDFALARQCLERAVALKPDDPFAYRNLAAAQMALGDREAARRSLTRALDLDPGNQQIRQQLETIGGPAK